MQVIDFSRFSAWDTDQVGAHATGIERYLIDMTRVYPPVDFLLEYKGVGCVPKGDLQAVTGKMKNGKSFACSCLEAAMLKGHFMGFDALKDDIRILHVDTEQSPATIVKRGKTVHTMSGWPADANNERYRILNLRECAYSDRLAIITEAIQQFQPDFVLIDGIRDLLADFNDPKESATLIDSLMRLCNEYGVGIMCVLHENKADTNMRGHLGTELGNKCSEVYQVSNNKTTTITVKQTESRNEPIDDWAFSIGEGGIPQQEGVSRVSSTVIKRDKCFAAIFKEGQSYTHTDLWQAFAKEYRCQERCAIGHITDATNEGVIRKKGNLYYYGPFLPSDECNLF